MKKNVIYISEAEALASGLTVLLALVLQGAEIVVESGHIPVAVFHAPPPRQSISERIARLPEHSTAVMDADFANDVALAIESHRSGY
jgi:guanylate kinase